MTPHKNIHSASIPSATKLTIEKNAITLLSEKGYDSTSMREIAELSGVTKPVIYYYFNSKENLCHYLVHSGLEDFRQKLTGVCEDGADNMFEQLVRAVDIHFDFCREHIEFTRFIYSLNFGPDKHKVDYDFHSYGREILQVMVRLMSRASKAGVIQEGKEEVAAVYLRGIINDYVMSFLEGIGMLPLKLSRTIVSDMVNGLGS
jgi:AcrR family transcriptional regulator